MSAFHVCQYLCFLLPIPRYSCAKLTGYLEILDSIQINQAPGMGNLPYAIEVCRGQSDSSTDFLSSRLESCWPSTMQYTISTLEIGRYLTSIWFISVQVCNTTGKALLLPKLLVPNSPIIYGTRDCASIPRSHMWSWMTLIVLLFSEHAKLDEVSGKHKCRTSNSAMGTKKSPCKRGFDV
jgi:hypothetical protein